MDCSEDSDCENDWKCLDFSLTLVLNEEYEEDGDYAGPPWWQRDDETKAIACMPEGFVALFNGQVGTIGMSGSSSENSDIAKTTALDDESDDDGDDETYDLIADEQGDEQSEDSDGGCSCSLSGRRSSPTYWITLIPLLVGYWLRRRNRA